MNNDIWAATAPATISGRPADTQRSPLLEAKVMMVDDEPFVLKEDEDFAVVRARLNYHFNSGY